jgi:endo-1,4-beta-xylanase
MRIFTSAVLAWLFASSFVLGVNDSSLKEAFKKDFLVGAAIGTDQALGKEPRALELVAEQFNTITPENLLKWQEVHPQPQHYDFTAADKFVEFGRKHHMFIVGHNLVWHNQTPPWVFEGETGAALTREALIARMREHIQSVVGRYRDQINGWDVVNEALADDGSMRKTKWQQTIGDEYLEDAFRFAHEADPKAELYYNDYNEWHPEKRRAIKALVQKLKREKIRIDGIGLQGHWGLDYPSTKEIDAMLSDYATLGVKLMITELDITVLPDPASARGAETTRNVSARKELNPYPDGLPTSMQQRLAERYTEIFRIFVKHTDHLVRVTFWGVHDGQSWRNNWPVRGRTDYPLLFDRQLHPKPAYNAVLSVLKTQTK